MKSAKPGKETKSEPLPSTPEEWVSFASRMRRARAAAARAHERADRKYRRAADRETLERADRYARIGVALGRDGVHRWMGTGQPVLGGRRR